MDYWTENYGHLPQYKSNTLPSRSFAQNYHDRPPPPQYQVYGVEQRAKTVDSGYYWPPRDVANWSNQESTAQTAPSHFPFNLGYRIPRYQGEQRQELQDWTTYQHQDQGWTYNPVHYKRELSKKEDNSFRELEAWALRYRHSLPRRRRIEAELRGAMQDNVERREMQAANVQELTLRDKASRQRALNYYQSAPQSQSWEVKDKISYQTKLCSHPPNYNAPPPYNVQYKNLLTQQILAKQSYELPQVVKQTEKELYEKYPAEIVTKGQSEQKRSNSDATKVIEGRKFQLNKKAGGMTIYCLVSRIADAEPEHVEQSEVCDVSEQSKLADEVDFKIQTSTKPAKSPYSKLQAIPICNARESNDVAAIGRLAAKFPLWRRPSFTSGVDADSACSKDIYQDIYQENYPKSCTESEKVATKDDDATLKIDTMCIVVKMESLKAPKKEQVHYLSSEDQTKTEQTLADDAAQCNEDVSTKQQDTGQIEDFDTLAEQAKSNDVVEGTIREDLLPKNSETLEERAKRICGLRDSTMAPQDDRFDLAAEDSPKQNPATNEFIGKRLYQKESMNAFSISQDENTQQVSSCNDEEAMRCKDIAEVDEPKENSTEENSNDIEKDNGVQEFKMAESQHLEFVPSKLPELEVYNDAEDSSEHEKVASRPILTPAKVLPHQEVKKEISEGSSDPIETIETCDVSEKDVTLSELETREEPVVQATSINTWQQLDGSQIEAAPTLPKSENEQNRCVKPTEAANVELYGCNMDKYRSVPKVISRIEEAEGGKDMEVVTSDFVIEEKGIDTIDETNKSVAIVDATSDEKQLDEKEREQFHILVASNDDANHFEETENEQQFGCREKDCASDAKNNIEENVLLSASVPHNQEVEPTTFTEPQEDVLSEDVEQNTGKEEENVNSDDIIRRLDDQKDADDVNDANLSDFEMQKSMKLNGNTEFGQEEVDNLKVTHEEGAIKDTDGFDLKDEEEREEIIVGAKLRSETADILGVHVLSPDKGFADCSLVRPSHSTANTGAAILERSCTSALGSEQSRPSTSSCENVCREEEGKYPKSLWDAVNRIRKHTAPDSENEEEEIADNWDRETLVSVENVFDNVEGGFDCTRTERCWCDLNVQDDAFSHCSSSSEESDGTIVDDELEETEMTNDESVEIYNEDRSSDGEEQGQNAAQTEHTTNQNQTEACPEGAEMAEENML